MSRSIFLLFFFFSFENPADEGQHHRQLIPPTMSCIENSFFWPPMIRLLLSISQAETNVGLLTFVLGNCSHSEKKKVKAKDTQ